MVRSNFPPSGGVFCGEELLDSSRGSGAPPVCVGLKGLEEACRELDSVEFNSEVRILPASSVTAFISAFATILCVSFACS